MKILKTYKRKEAIKTLSIEQLKYLDEVLREAYILDYWVLDSEDEEFHFLSISLQKEILEHDDFVGDASDKKYNELILLALASLYRGVTNEFLAKAFFLVKHDEILLEGEVETLLSCPCCQYETLDAYAEYDICRLCMWEDDGSGTDNFSCVNGKTLREAREKFMQILHTLPLDKFKRSV